jgi:hypothetical protein
VRWRSLMPTEHQEQVAVIEWTESQKARLPEASLIYANANGGERPSVKLFRHSALVRFSEEGLRLKKEGVKPGIPDLCLPVARRQWHSLYIEMKRLNGNPTVDQDLWMAVLTLQGHAVSLCRGADEGIAAIEGYLTRDDWRPVW